jgi:hypothetical protein
MVVMATDPSVSHPARMRIGDRERADAAERLSAHAAAGRLSVDELEERLARAHAAVHAGDLAVLEADLPAPARRPEPQRRPPLAAIAVTVLVAAVLASVLLGHPVAPLFLAAVLAWRAAQRGPRHRLAPGARLR